MGFRELQQAYADQFPALGLVGQTPLVRVDLFRDEFPEVEVYAKMEPFNPGGSLKDRPVLYMMLDAFERGELSAERTLIDSSSGNAGIAYAWIGGVLGVPVKLVIPNNASAERKKRILSHGAEIHFTEAHDGYDEALRVTGDYTRLNVRALLPQIHGPELMAYLDMPGLAPPATAALWNSLPDAAASAFALPAIDTRNDAGARARTAAVHTARRHLSITRMSQLMHIRRRTVQRLDHARVRSADVRAVRMQLTLRNIRKAQGASPSCSVAIAI